MLSRMYLKTLKIPTSLLGLSFLVLLYVCYMPYGVSYFGIHFIGQASLLVIITAFARNGYSKEESFLGSLTYSIYLIHLPVLLVVSHIGHLGGLLRLIPLGIALALSLIVARFIEEDIVERSRKKWLNSWKPSGSGAVMKSGGYSYMVLAILFLSMTFYSRDYLSIIHLQNCSVPQGGAPIVMAATCSVRVPASSSGPGRGGSVGNVIGIGKIRKWSAG